MNLPTLHLDQSTPTNLYFERDGQRVSIEEAFKDGFRVDPEDAPAILTQAAQFLQNLNDAYYLP